MTTAIGLQWINTVIGQFVGSITVLFTETPFIATMIFVVILFFVIRAVIGIVGGKY